MVNSFVKTEQQLDGWRKWWEAARPRTLPAGVSPVVAACAVVSLEHSISWALAILCGVVALALQVGVNYANDYSDGIRGTDAHRVGPVRLTATGLATPHQVKRAATIALVTACVAGIAVSFLSQPLVVAVGLIALGGLSVAAALLYTGGPKPYGYSGFGELMVFVFFGLVATVGTFYVQTSSLSLAVLLVAIAMGCWAVAMLLANNLRDLEPDRVAGKRTLVVRLGDEASRWMYVAMIALTFIAIGPVLFLNTARLAAVPFLVLAALAALVAKKVRRGARGMELVAVLKSTGQLQLCFVALFFLACLLA